MTPNTAMKRRETEENQGEQTLSPVLKALSQANRRPCWSVEEDTCNKTNGKLQKVQRLSRERASFTRERSGQGREVERQT